MKTKKLFSIFVIAMIAILMLMAVMSTVQAVDAASKVKVTWNANGGKVGADKIATTTVTKGVKIGKLPKTPEKTGYTFAGWYTKKSGGTKIITTTKVKKEVTYYAHWTKPSSRALNGEEKKLIGAWSAGPYLQISNSNLWIEFKKDGTFKRENSNIGKVGHVEGYWYQSGKWKIVGNKIVCTNIKETWLRKPGTGKYVGDYKDKAIADQTWNYYFSDKTTTTWQDEITLTWLSINHYPGVKDLSRFEDYVKPI